MEHTRLVARLLSEVASARAAITASYVHLWQADARSSADPNHSESGPGLLQDRGAGSQRDERSPDDVG
jgi:hypothetical protein